MKHGGQSHSRSGCALRRAAIGKATHQQRGIADRCGNHRDALDTAGHLQADRCLRLRVHLRGKADRHFLTGLRRIAEIHAGEFRLTANQNVIVANVAPEDRPAVEALVAKHGLLEGASALRRNAIACVALPTCGLALAESERYLPDLLTRLEERLAAHGLAEDEITIRMTGCPNGCARPYIAEIGLVGKGPGRYNLYLGAAFAGERLGKLYGDNLTESEILSALDPLFAAWAAEREPDEHFGDFMVRTGRVARTTNGPDFHAETGPRTLAA